MTVSPERTFNKKKNNFIQKTRKKKPNIITCRPTCITTPSVYQKFKHVFGGDEVMSPDESDTHVTPRCGRLVPRVSTRKYREILTFKILRSVPGRLMMETWLWWEVAYRRRRLRYTHCTEILVRGNCGWFYFVELWATKEFHYKVFNSIEIWVLMENVSPTKCIREENELFTKYRYMRN